MINDVTGPDGLVERWDDNAKTYTDFRVTPAVTRPYTPAEIAAADSRLAVETAQVSRQATRNAVGDIVADLVAEKTRAQTIIDKANASITAADTKDLARAVKRVADAATDLAKFVG